VTTVLLDENIDRRLARQFPPDQDVETVSEIGWSGGSDQELLDRAEEAFDVLVTMDQNLRYQQNLNGRSIGVVVVRAKTNRPSDVEPLMDSVAEAARAVEAGTVIEVGP
jgi:predicted nuclease of predicted toxin-antitoxin system